MNFKIHLTFLILFSSFLFAEIKGTVMDQSTDEPLQGVNITGEKTGTATNESGEFSIDVPLGTKLEFSYIGYHSISQSAQNGMSVEMSPAVIKSKEIVVRAGLSDESLQKTTASVTVFTANDIRESGADHFQALINQIPNLNWAGGTSRPRYFQIRGIGERSQYTGGGSPNFSVGYMVDGIDFSGIGMVGMLFDTKQIEVFKGPQSSIYGPNAMAGLINIITAAPTPYFTGNSVISLGSDNQKTAGFAVGGPLSKKVLFRFAVQQHNQDGFRENVHRELNNTNRRVEHCTRTKLHWTISPIVMLQIVNFNAHLNNGYDAWSIDNNKDFINIELEYIK